MTIYLSEHSTFSTKEQLNKNISLHLQAHRYELNDTDRQVFNLLSRYSVKYLGASHLKMSTIADKLSKSRRTIQYSIKKLISLKMLKKISFMRKVAGGYGANLYVILPFDQSDCTSVIAHREEATNSITSKDDSSKSEKEPSYSYKQRTYKENTYQDAPTTFYGAFCNRVRAFMYKADTVLLRALYGVYRAQSIPLLKFDIYKDKQEQFEALAMQAITISMQATKKKPVRNLTGFFSGVLRNLILKHVIELDESIPASNEPLEWFIPHGQASL